MTYSSLSGSVDFVLVDYLVANLEYMLHAVAFNESFRRHYVQM